RYRSRWGRRNPFIILTMPFLCVCLALLGLSDDITGWLHRNAIFLQDFAPATITIALIAVFLIMFQFFNMFVGSMFWYLFNDVVPQQFLGRFIGAIRIVGTGAGAMYNFFIFKYADTHMREIFLGIALLYMVALGLMCMMVKEGEYPPIEGEDEPSKRGIGSILTFFRECFTHRFYWMIFGAGAISALNIPMWSFWVFFLKEMGLSLDQIGKLGGVGGVSVMVAMFFVSVFIDRWHPLRILVYAAVFSAV
ncbi:MAG: MFS transporter, partial [Lentisphaerae bacterium]|nr:MFS transporter [Lentisphaerota bacterium]